MKAPALLIHHDKRGVVGLTLNRQEVHNAFDENLIAQLSAVFQEFGRDDAVRVIVLGASGRTFCAGADIAWMRRAAAQGALANLEDAQRFATMIAAVAQCPKPVIAQIQGPAYGGGVGLVCAADVAIAGARARFAVTEAKFGILPAVIGPYLVNAVGPRQARRLALTCSVIGATEALSLGLVQQVVGDDDLPAAVDSCVDELLRGGPKAQGFIKHLFGALQVGPVTAEVQASTARTISQVRATEEAREGFEAFVAKRPASWMRS